MSIPELHLPRLREPVSSFPSEPAWSSAAAVSLRRAQDAGAPALATRVCLLDDGARLHVRFDCDDADPWATHTGHDAPLWEEEVVEIFLAPGGGDPRSYVEIEVNPLGAVFDARVSNPDGRRDTMTVDLSWDPSGLAARVRRDPPRGWTAEISLPWADVADVPPGGVWRANFFRIKRPRSGAAEFTCWSPTLADPPDFHRPTCFGRLLRPTGV